MAKVKATRKQHVSELLASVPGCIEPPRMALEEIGKVHHRGCAQSSSYHGKYGVGRLRTVFVEFNIGVTSPEQPPALPTEAEPDELARMIME